MFCPRNHFVHTWVLCAVMLSHECGLSFECCMLLRLCPLAHVQSVAFTAACHASLFTTACAVKGRKFIAVEFVVVNIVFIPYCQVQTQWFSSQLERGPLLLFSPSLEAILLTYFTDLDYLNMPFVEILLVVYLEVLVLSFMFETF